MLIALIIRFIFEKRGLLIFLKIDFIYFLHIIRINIINRKKMVVICRHGQTEWNRDGKLQ